MVVVLLAVFVSEPEKTTFSPVDSKFVNSSGGYILSVPKGFQLDKDFLPHTARLVSDDCVIEIYSQPCNGAEEITSYINYTNRAVVSNNIDYSNVNEINDSVRTVLIWERKKLLQIKNDKNHYLKIDIPQNGRVYTILVKSSGKISDYKKYEALLETYDKTLVRDVLDKAYSEERTVELTLQPPRDSDGKNTMFLVLDGNVSRAYYINDSMEMINIFRESLEKG